MSYDWKPGRPRASRGERTASCPHPWIDSSGLRRGSWDFLFKAQKDCYPGRPVRGHGHPDRLTSQDQAGSCYLTAHIFLLNSCQIFRSLLRVFCSVLQERDLPVLTTGPVSPKSWALGLLPKLDPWLASVSWRLSEFPFGPSFYTVVSSPSLRSFLSRKEAFPGPCPHCSPPGALFPSDLAMPGWCQDHLVLLCRVWRLMSHRDKLKARALAHCYFSITARDLKGKQDFCSMCPRVPECPHCLRPGSVNVGTIVTGPGDASLCGELLAPSATTQQPLFCWLSQPKTSLAAAKCLRTLWSRSAAPYLRGLSDSSFSFHLTLKKLLF